MEDPNNAIVFVTEPDGQSQMSQDMKIAFKSFHSRKFNPRFVSGSTILGNKEKVENVLFVLESFSGQIFDHLKEQKARIISPYVVNYCDKGKFDTIPMRSGPLFSQCMRGLRITFTGMPTETKEQLKDKIVKMAAIYDPDLNATTKVLVSNSVLSKKYQAAMMVKIPVLRMEWIEDCWQKYQYDYAYAEEIKEKYFLPIFHGLTITVSQIDKEEREKIQELVEMHGGTYSRSLRTDVIAMILLLREKTGEKYVFAKKKNIPRLKFEWLEESIKKGFALDEKNFSIDEETKDDEPQPTGDVGENATNLNRENKPHNDNQSAAKSKTNNDSNAPKDLVDQIEELALNVSEERSFLEDEVIWPIGFDRPQFNAIKTASRLCGAICTPEFKPIVTHVIIGPLFNSNEANMKQIMTIDKIVNIDWFISSLQLSKCLSHIPYKYHISQQTSNGTDSSSGSRNKLFNLDLFTTDTEAMCKQIEITGTVVVNPSRPHIQMSQNYKSLEGDSDEENEIKWSPKVKLPLNLRANDNIQKRTNQDKAVKRIFPETDPKSDQSNKKGSSSNSTISDVEDGDEEVHPSSDTSRNPTNSLTSSKAGTAGASNNSPNVTPVINSSSSNRRGTSLISNYVFMFSGFSDLDEKERLSKCVAEILKVRVTNDLMVPKDLTHLILYEPFASEKTLSAIASGLWIMKPEYIHNSLAAGKLLPEVDYEWGSNLSEPFNVRKRLMSSAKVWRQHREQTGKNVFQDWSVMFLNQSRMNASTINILKAGKAKLYYVDDYVERINELKILLKEVKYAVIDTKFEQKFLFNKKMYLGIIKVLSNKKIIFRNEFVSRFIIDGQPGTSPSEKCMVSFEDIENALTAFH